LNVVSYLNIKHELEGWMWRLRNILL
jgi:hypothetical protein